MANGNQGLPIDMTAEQIRKANKAIVDDQNKLFDENKREVRKLRMKLAFTYWVIIALSVIMFIVGIGLLIVPFITALKGDMKIYESIVSGGFGIADLAGLFLLKPIQRIHKMMGDMSQVLLVLNSFQTQSALRLLQMDINLRATIGETAEKIGKITEDCVTLIENYFEKTGDLKA